MCETLTTNGEIEILISFPEPRICDGCEVFSSGRFCARCGFNYCAHFASKVDTAYCQYCFHDFVLEDTIITKEIRSKSLKGNKTFVRTMKARHLVFKGEAWMFAQRRVIEMSDEELATSIEYHREIFSQMMDERDARQIQKNRLAIKRMVRTSADIYNPARDSGAEVGGIIGMRSTTIKTTRVTKTKITNQGGANPMLAMQGLVNMLKAQGLTDVQIGLTLQTMLSKAAIKP